MAVTARIIRFYTGEEPDHRGRYLHEIQQWPDGQLEGVHDYIQWLFPLPESSGFNVAAPVLNRESIQDFRNRPDVQDKLRVSFLRLMNFFGLEARSGERDYGHSRSEFCGQGDTLAFSRKSQSSADHENPEVLERSGTGRRGKSVLRLFV